MRLYEKKQQVEETILTTLAAYNNQTRIEKKIHDEEQRLTAAEKTKSLFKGFETRQTILQQFLSRQLGITLSVASQIAAIQIAMFLATWINLTIKKNSKSAGALMERFVGMATLSTITMKLSLKKRKKKY